MWELGLFGMLLVIITIVLLTKPLFKTYSEQELSLVHQQENQRKELNIQLYKQKKLQIEQDVKNGLLDNEGKLQAQNEIDHELIQDAEYLPVTDLRQSSYKHAISLSIVIGLFVTIFSIVTYATIKPNEFDQVVLGQKPEPLRNSQTNVPDINDILIKLENKLKVNPNDLQGWSMLGRSYVIMKRHSDAVLAFEKALKLNQSDKELLPDLPIDYVEALMLTREQSNYEKARLVLDTLLVAEPNNRDALWFMGFLDYDAGNKQLAVERWMQLISLLPKDSKQANIVHSFLNEVQSELSLKMK